MRRQACRERSPRIAGSPEPAEGRILPCMRTNVWVAGIACLALLLCACRMDDTDEGQAFLRQSWEAYKEVFITADGYVWDRSRDGGEVTSEGQSYALLRAAWMDDRAVFERVFAWTERHLLRPDGLYAWRWHPGGNGQPAGVLDANTATDADQDIALALIIAGRRFDHPAYRERAAALLRAIRSTAALPLTAGWFLSAGNWAGPERIMNISYFMPHAYPLFQQVDPDGDWLGLRARGYAILARLTHMSPTGLLPDFNVLTVDGEVQPLGAHPSLRGDFSFDAMRTQWRVAMDCQWHGHPQACADPARTVNIAQIIARDGKLFARYDIETGEPRTDVVSISFLGALLPAFRLHAPALADALLRTDLSEAALTPLLRNPDRYYDLNWMWFGLAGESGFLMARTMP